MEDMTNEIRRAHLPPRYRHAGAISTKQGNIHKLQDAKSDEQDI